LSIPEFGGVAVARENPCSSKINLLPTATEQNQDISATAEIEIERGQSGVFMPLQ
jgi:hypothetical protein